jgi:AcrR family transcriptional regulator
MSPRPRKVSDDEIFAATTRVTARAGPRGLTLAMIADEAGLTAGALVQRFGSRRGLLLALSARVADSTDELFAGLRAAAPSPLAALHAYAQCLAGMGTSPTALANSLAWLQQDVADPAFRRFTQRQARASRRQLQRLVTDAIAQGELARGVDAQALARAIEVTVGGSLMAWAIYQEGSAGAWIRHDLDALLQVHRPRRRSTRKP